MLEISLIEEGPAVAAAMDPIKAQLLSLLVEPASAASLAAKLELPRQKINYHLNMLLEHGLVEVVEERKWGGITERIMQATAQSFVISPGSFDAATADPSLSQDRLSARYLIALAGRAIRDVTSIVRHVSGTGQRVPTLTIDTEIGFQSAEDRAAFASELTDAIAALAAKYHHDHGRPHRVVAMSYPKP